MLYCGESDKPIVKYKFGEGKYRRFKSEFSPIEIITKTVPIDETDNYNGEGYQISFYSPTTDDNFEPIVTNHKVEYIFTDYYGWIHIISFANCGYKELQPGLSYEPSTLVINPNIKCPIEQALKNRCSIIILHKGIIIHQDQGDCNISVEVQCGNCPENSIECKTSNYPGYCCIPCVPTANKIDNLSNSVRLL